MVFNGVIGAAIEEASDGGPLVAEAGVGPDDGVILFRSKRPVLDLRGELVAPSQPTRLTGSTRDRFAYKRPVSRAIVLDQSL